MPLPSPAELLGLPDSKFDSWFPGQESIFSRIMEWYHSDARFLGLAVPTGSGKTILALLTAKLSGSRTVVLTESKGLQGQYLGDGRPLGMTDVRGQNNFSCLLAPGTRADEGSCHDGVPCPLKAQSCPYQVQLNRALASQLVLSNYAYYLAQTNFSQRGLGEIGLLVLDEAHRAFPALESHLTIHLSRMDVEPVGIQFPPYPLLPIIQERSEKRTPGQIKEQSLAIWECWRSWAEESLPLAQSESSRLDNEVKALRQSSSPVPSHLSRASRLAKGTVSKLMKLAAVFDSPWVIQRTTHGYRFVPLWVAPYSSALFHEVPKVLLMSAILSHKTADSLGIPAEPEQRSWIEVGSHFPPQNTPIWHIPSARITHRVDDYGTTMWSARIDQIIDRRLDRKGIIFTVSYERARSLIQRSRHSGIMLSHGQSDVASVVDRFKRMPPPAVLVSPTVTTGWDFPGLNYIVIGKVPFPDTRDTVAKARHDEDKEWDNYVAMGTVIQEAGRGTRSAADQCAVFVVDDSWQWFYWANRKFAPRWFQQRVRGSLQSVPDPIFKEVSVMRVEESEDAGDDLWLNTTPLIDFGRLLRK